MIGWEMEAGLWEVYEEDTVRVDGCWFLCSSSQAEDEFFRSRDGRKIWPLSRIGVGTVFYSFFPSGNVNIGRWFVLSVKTWIVQRGFAIKVIGET